MPLKVYFLAPQGANIRNCTRRQEAFQVIEGEVGRFQELYIATGWNKLYDPCPKLEALSTIGPSDHSQFPLPYLFSDRAPCLRKITFSGVSNSPHNRLSRLTHLRLFTQFQLHYNMHWFLGILANSLGGACLHWWRSNGAITSKFALVAAQPMAAIMSTFLIYILSSAFHRGVVSPLGLVNDGSEAVDFLPIKIVLQHQEKIGHDMKSFIIEDSQNSDSSQLLGIHCATVRRISPRFCAQVGFLTVWMMNSLRRSIPLQVPAFCSCCWLCAMRVTYVSSLRFQEYIFCTYCFWSSKSLAHFNAGYLLYHFDQRFTHVTFLFCR